MKVGKKNKVSSSILDYNIALIGESGIGKTTLAYNVCEKLVGPEGYLFLECGKEDGAGAIEGINYVTVDTWNDDYDEDKNTIGFKSLIDDIVENKTSDYPELKTIVIDTIDELCILSKEEVVRMHNRKHPDKKVDSVRAAFGGFMAGEDMANQMILDSLWELKKVGVAFIIIGHTKIREQQDLASGDTYSQLTTNMSLRDFNAIKTKLHFLGVAYNDRNIIKEKSKKDPKKTIGTIMDESRKIVFRSDDFSVDSKSRFANIVPEIPLNADAFIKALEDAIANSIPGSLEERQKEDTKKEEKRIKEIAKAEEEHKAAGNLDDVLAKIKQFCSDNKGNKEKLAEIIGASKERGFSNPMKIDNIDDAEEILKLCV